MKIERTDILTGCTCGVNESTVICEYCKNLSLGFGRLNGEMTQSFMIRFSAFLIIIFNMASCTGSNAKNSGPRKVDACKELKVYGDYYLDEKRQICFFVNHGINVLPMDCCRTNN